jgi:sulfur carrier protein ThiS
MRVSVRLYSVLQRLSPAFADFREIELQEASHVSDILKKVGISQETGFVVLVNHLSVDLNQVLSDGDKVEILPLVSGG